MADKPGYTKPLLGKRSKIPRDYVTCHGRRIRRSVVVVRMPVDRRFGRNRDIPRGLAFVAPVKCPDSLRRHRRGGRKKGPKHDETYTPYGRYRERNPQFERIGDLAAGSKLGTFKIFQNNQVSSSTILNTTGSHAGSISSERCWDQKHPGPPYKTVGPFALLKTSVPGAGVTSGSSHRSSQFSPGFWWQYDGKFCDDGDWMSDSVGNYLTTVAPAIVGYDTLAWDKLKPRVSKSGMAQFFYELRDLPGMLKTSASNFSRIWESISPRRTGVTITFPSGGGSPSTRVHRGRDTSFISAVMDPQDLADNFLNHQFGWVPFLSDLASMYDAYQRSHELISELARTNGTWIRKRAVLKSETVQRHLGRRYSAGVEPFGFQIQGLCDTRNIDGIPCKGYFDLTEVVETKVWAQGLFTFYRPEYDMNLEYNDSYIGALQRLMTLYGLRITPTLLYKVTPWSWTVDWFSGFGKWIERYDDFTVDGIVSKQLCIMARTKRYVTKTAHIFFQSGDRTFSWKREFESKVRKVADCPYGFDQTWNNLSLRQWAILGAIGISRTNTGFISRGA